MPESDSPENDVHAPFVSSLNKLFFAAWKASPFNALCSILRVGGMSDANWEPFEESRQAFEDYNWALEKARHERGSLTSRRISLLMYCQAVEMNAPHEMLANLLRCICGQSYSISTFSHLYRAKNKNKGRIGNYIPPSAKTKFREITALAKSAGQLELIGQIEAFFDERIRNAFSHSDYVLTDAHFRFSDGCAQQIPIGELDNRIAVCFLFYGAFLSLHRNWLKQLMQAKRFHKWPDYEVLELLSSPEEGVYGFKVHFSNGAKAVYSRRSIGTEAINIGFDRDGELVFHIGPRDKLEPVWKVEGKTVENWESLR